MLTNIELGTERVASAPSSSGGSDGSSAADGEAGGDGSGYTTAAADGTYAGAPFGGANCAQAGQSKASPWLLALLLLALAPLRRRS